jgi:hypothetical protein
VLLGEILGALDVLVGAARRPAYEDELEVAERISTTLLASKTKLTRSRAANLAAKPARLAEAPVLASAVTAMAQLLIGGDPHEDAVDEMTVAMGVGDLLDAAGGCDLILIRQGFATRPVLSRLRAVQNADAGCIRAARDIMTALWSVIENLQSVPADVSILRLSGGDPHMFALKVGILLVCGADNGYNVAGLLQAGRATGALDSAQTARVVAAGDWLSERSLHQTPAALAHPEI